MCCLCSTVSVYVYCSVSVRGLVFVVVAAGPSADLHLGAAPLASRGKPHSVDMLEIALGARLALGAEARDGSQPIHTLAKIISDQSGSV